MLTRWASRLPVGLLVTSALLLAGGTASGAEEPAPQVRYHVSPQGDDTNPGTAAAPLRSLARARDAVRQNPLLGKQRLEVVLEGGRYFITETLELTEKDSGAEGAPVVYAAAPEAEAILDGGKVLPPGA